MVSILSTKFTEARPSASGQTAANESGHSAGREHHQEISRRHRPPPGQFRSASGGNPCALRGKRRGQISPDQTALRGSWPRVLRGRSLRQRFAGPFPLHRGRPGGRHRGDLPGIGPRRGNERGGKYLSRRGAFAPRLRQLAGALPRSAPAARTVRGANRSRGKNIEVGRGPKTIGGNRQSTLEKIQTPDP